MGNRDVFFELIENSQDFLLNSVTVLKENDNRGFGYRIFTGFDGFILKQAYISGVTSIELLLKSLIVFHNWESLFDKKTKPNYERLMSGDFKSVDFSCCISILKNKFNYCFNEKQKREIEKHRLTRNKLIHFKNDELENNYISLISECIDLYLEIYTGFIKPIHRMSEIESVDYDLIKIDKYKEIRQKSLSVRLSTFNRPTSTFLSNCPNCDLDMLIFSNKNRVKCLFCNTEIHIEDVAQTMNPAGLECPKCKMKTVIHISDMTDVNKTVLNCINCNYKE